MRHSVASTLPGLEAEQPPLQLSLSALTLSGRLVLDRADLRPRLFVVGRNVRPLASLAQSLVTASGGQPRGELLDEAPGLVVGSIVHGVLPSVVGALGWIPTRCS